MGTVQFCIPKPAADAVGINDGARRWLAARGFDVRLAPVAVSIQEREIRITCERQIAEVLLDELRERALSAPSVEVRDACEQATVRVIDSFWAAYEGYSSAARHDADVGL